MQNIVTKVVSYKNKKLVVLNFLSKNKRLILPFLFILSYGLIYFLVDPSSQSLVAHDEGLYARRSRLVAESFNWFSSPFDSPHHKTLGSYWFIALSIKLLGKNELALRLPSILASFICLFISYLIAVKISNKKSAFISVLSLSSMPLWIQYSRYASPDIPFVLCILLVVFFFLNYLDSNKLLNQSVYIFLSGLFVSTAFFIRSYMLFVPLIGLIGLTPFLFKHLFRAKNIFKVLFSFGIVIGFIPTCLNFYFSYQKFGLLGITSLFDFARNQAIGVNEFNNFLFLPLNFLYLTFPIGLLLVILFLFTRSNNTINYPLLIYIYPAISLSILLLMSTSYPHYFLFLLPSLSILLAINIDSYSFRFLLSKKIMKFSLIIIMSSISFGLVYFIFNYNDYLIKITNGKPFIAYLSSTLLILAFISSLRFLLDTGNRSFNLLYFLLNILLPQYISLSIMYNFGVIGNPNLKTKLFLKDSNVSTIIKSNTIYLYNVDSKIMTLLSYYLPFSSIIRSTENVNDYKYIITSDRTLSDIHRSGNLFKEIQNFDNHFLLMNISK